MTKKPKKTRWGCLIIPIALTLLICGTFLADQLTKDQPSNARTRLPDTATEIQEFYEESLFPPEFNLLLKARIPEHEVEAYAQLMGAINKESGQTGKEFFSWSRNIDWFDPQEDPLYYHYEQQYRIIVGWENGYVYLDVCQW